MTHLIQAYIPFAPIFAVLAAKLHFEIKDHIQNQPRRICALKRRFDPPIQPFRR